jgi:acylphosphatase
MKTMHLKISGKVQGVSFRARAKEQALDLAIKGWIKNTQDGDVEVLITGDESEVQNFINWCAHGPDKAKVTRVITTSLEIQVFSDFKIIR